MANLVSNNFFCEREHSYVAEECTIGGSGQEEQGIIMQV